MKPKIRGWKEGIITEDLKSVGGSGHKKGDTVRYKRKKEINTDPDNPSFYTGKYEYHYVNTDNMNLVRCYQLLIVE